MRGGKDRSLAEGSFPLLVGRGGGGAEQQNGSSFESPSGLAAISESLRGFVLKPFRRRGSGAR